MLLIRRTTAVALILAAGVLAVLPYSAPAAGEATVLVAKHDLAPGHVLARGDLVRRAMPPHLVPRGALRDSAQATGKVLSGAARGGEPLTDVRLASNELTRLTTGDATRVAVPVRLADAGIADLLHAGRRVDLITVATPSSESSGASVLAERVPVIAVRPPNERNDQGRLIVVGLPAPHAARVASASLSRAVTVTLR